MKVSRKDFLAIAVLLFDGPDIGHYPWIGIQTAYNCYFALRDPWEDIHDYYKDYVEGRTQWPKIISTAWYSGRRVSDANASVIQEVMNEFQDHEVLYKEIWA